MGNVFGRFVSAAIVLTNGADPASAVSIRRLAAKGLDDSKTDLDDSGLAAEDRPLTVMWGLDQGKPLLNLQGGRSTPAQPAEDRPLLNLQGEKVTIQGREAKRMTGAELWEHVAKLAGQPDLKIGNKLFVGEHRVLPYDYNGGHDVVTDYFDQVAPVVVRVVEMSPPTEPSVNAYMIFADGAQRMNLARMEAYKKMQQEKAQRALVGRGGS